MENSEEIDDYVLNSQGVIWRGNYRQKLSMFWDYGQVRSNTYVFMKFGFAV